MSHTRNVGSKSIFSSAKLSLPISSSAFLSSLGVIFCGRHRDADGILGYFTVCLDLRVIPLNIYFVNMVWKYPPNYRTSQLNTDIKKHCIINRQSPNIPSLVSQTLNGNLGIKRCIRFRNYSKLIYADLMEFIRGSFHLKRLIVYFRFGACSKQTNGSI